MNKEHLRKLLRQVADGSLNTEAALQQLKDFPYEEMGFAKLDHHRTLRRGFPEVILCKGKTTEQVVTIFGKMIEAGNLVMATKAEPGLYQSIQNSYPSAVYHETAQIVLSGKMPERKTDKIVAVITAGTSDIPVAEEAAVTAEVMGNPVERIFDIGVAGVHRLLDNREKILKANVVVVVAGMEGALASVVGGMVDKPVVAVPTSVGYGAAFDGLAALLSMLNSCSPGIAVMNIDNGFGAGYFAGMVNQMGIE